MGLKAGKQKGILPNVCPSGFGMGKRRETGIPCRTALGGCGPLSWRLMLVQLGGMEPLVRGTPLSSWTPTMGLPSHSPLIMLLAHAAEVLASQAHSSHSLGDLWTQLLFLLGTGRGWSLFHAHGLPSLSSCLNILQHQALPRVRFPANRLWNEHLWTSELLRNAPRRNLLQTKGKIGKGNSWERVWLHLVETLGPANYDFGSQSRPATHIMWSMS